MLYEGRITRDYFVRTYAGDGTWGWLQTDELEFSTGGGEMESLPYFSVTS